MSHHKYIIIGGGMTADSAIRGIREADPSGTVAIISDERDPPYDRPPLSKALWKGKAIESVWRNTAGPGICLYLDRRAIAIDRARKTVTDDQESEYTYEKLLLATGGRARRLPTGNQEVIYFRTLDDYRRLRAVTEHHSEFAVIGGGFIGSEIASALAMNGKKVTMIFPEKSIGARAYPRPLGIFLNAYYRDKGVNLLCGETVSAVETAGDKLRVRTSGRNAITADAVIAGMGIVPEVGLAQSAGLRVDNGVVVDECLRTADPAIYAAGDVANFYSPALDARIRVEHEDNANTMGRIAGGNMAGRLERYHHLPMFYSDLFDQGYEAVGVLDASLDVVEDWKQQFRKGVIYYLKDDRVRGVLLWNTWGQVDAARGLITSRQKFDAASLKGRIVD
jgi:3-phenylpropionate/trans-cinnamate dioxygenase ferredoxin reductase component